MEHKLIENPKTNEVFFTDFERGRICSINGMSFEATRLHRSWADVTKTEPPYLFEWQRDPGTYGPHYVAARLTMPNGTFFTAGGSFLYITAWAKEQSALVVLLKCYSDRNVARRSAEVAW